MIENMIIVTTDGAIEVWSKTTTSLDRVIVASKQAETLKGIVGSIELAGASEDAGDVGKWDQIQYDAEHDFCYLELDRTTFKIWFAFEVDGYLRYGKNEFETAVTEPGHWQRVQEMRGLVYEI